MRAHFWVRVVAALLVAMYLSFIVVHSQLGPNDEYAFLPTLQSGKPFPLYGEDFPYYNSVELGRFGPLGGQEYNLVALFTTNPVAYYAFNAMELVVFVWAFLRILGRFTPRSLWNYAALATILFLPAFAIPFFKLLYVEKNVLLFLTLLVLAFIEFHRSGKLGYFAMGLGCANIALYYKEPVFIAIGALAFSHLLLIWKSSSRASRFFDLTLIASAVLYATLYAVKVLPNVVRAYGTHPVDNSLLVFAKNAANYGLFSDPIPILILLPLTAWRIYRVLFRCESAHPLLDPMLAAGSAYVAVFFVLNMYSPYYLLPVYLFALPPALYFWKQGELHGIFWKGSFSLVGLVLVLNAIPMGIHYITYNKYVPINFNRTLDFLVRDVDRRYEGRRLNIFFDGVDRGSGRGVYFIVGEYLKFKGLPMRKFDLVSDMEARDPSPFIGKPSPFDRKEEVKEIDPEGRYSHPQFPFAVFQPGPLPQVQKGDYLVVSPQSVKNVNGAYLESLKRDYELVFRTQSPFAVPSLNLKAVMKQMAAKGNGAPGLMVNENILNWPDYSVWVKK